MAESCLAGRILITGGAGYIGSHTTLCLLEAGYKITVVDSLINSNKESLRRVMELTGCSPDSLVFHEVDVCNLEQLDRIFASSEKFDACIHFAGLKAVGESVREPLKYYSNNIDSTIVLLKCMKKYGCRSLVFSSSATVYGPAAVPITEETPAGNGITNAYGRTKYMIEEILKDFKRSVDLEGKEEWSIATLRYFNPVGAHPSGRIGEDPCGEPNNLMPYVAQVAVGRRAKLTVFGADYATKDGTGVRDYIHVMDLAEGHLAALRYMTRPLQPASATEKEAEKEAEKEGEAKRAKRETSGRGCGKYSVFNLGSGCGYSVLEMLRAMGCACGRELAYEFGARREGDVDVCFADTARASAELGWTAQRSLADMCNDLWRWQSNNPNGYEQN